MPDITLAEQIAAVRKRISKLEYITKVEKHSGMSGRRHESEIAAMRAVLDTLLAVQPEGEDAPESTSRIAALDAVADAARKAYKEFTCYGVPVQKTDDLLPTPYWSPSARMIDSGTMMALGEALDAVPADAGRMPLVDALREHINNRMDQWERWTLKDASGAPVFITIGHYDDGYGYDDLDALPLAREGDEK